MELEDLIFEINEKLDEGIIDFDKLEELVDYLEEKGYVELAGDIKSCLDEEDIECLRNVLSELLEEIEK